jgi:hypothetical protein
MPTIEGERQIAAPSEDKPPLKANVFHFLRAANSALTPMFPYVGDGDIVPCASILRGGPGCDAKAFNHENSVDEVAICFAAENSRLRSGFVHVGARKHVVGNFFEDPTNPDNLTAIVVTQRQADAGNPQEETLTFFCEECQAPLLTHTYSAKVEDPERDALPGFHGPLETLTEGAICLEPFNENEEQRTCSRCGHVNDPFPVSVWGWDHYNSNFIASERARRMFIDRSVASDR